MVLQSLGNPHVKTQKIGGIYVAEIQTPLGKEARS
jgi:hypothetical protein